MAADRFSINKSWDQVQNKFVGTGHSDMSKFEWASNQHRDTIASHIGESTLLSLPELTAVAKCQTNQCRFIFVF